MNKAQQDIRRKTRVLEHAARIGNVRKTCRYFGVARSGFYVWKKAYETHGDEGRGNQKPCPYNPRLRTPPDIVEKVLHLRRTYHLGPIRIGLVSRALSRHHDFESQGLPHPPAPRPESTNQSRRTTSRAHAQVRQTPGRFPPGRAGASSRCRHRYSHDARRP